MIPVKLFLRNFMCYRDDVPPLYFDGIHLACLCGDNGNGKSALLDAITWALWGKSRAKSDDELLHLGKGEMEVEFDFKVNDDQYRVMRKRSKTRLERPGQTLLDFQVATPDGFRSICGDTLRQTEQKIIHTIRMDYTTFINSAFLRQGHADEFTIRSPGDRKKVLSDIIGLSFYDELEERAKSYVKSMEQQQRAFQNTIEEMQQEIERKEEYETTLLDIRKALGELEKEVQSQEAQVISLREDRKTLDFKQDQLTELEKAIEQTREELNRWQDQLLKHNHKIAEYEKVLQQGSEIGNGYAQLQKVKGENADLNLKLEKSFALTKRKDHLVQVVNEARGRKLEERGRAQHKVEELETKSGQITKLEEELAIAKNSLVRIAQEEKELEEKRQQAQEMVLRIQYLKSANAQLSQEVKGLEDKLALLMQGEAKCPLCETELGIEGKQRIGGKYKAEINTRVEEQRKNKAEIKQKETEHQQTDRQTRQSELRVNQERVSTQSQITSLEREISLSKEAELGLTKVRAYLTQIEEQLTREEFATAEQESLKKVQQQLIDLEYDADRHHQVQQLLIELEKYEALQRKLEEAERNLPVEQAALNQAKEAFTKWNLTLEKDRRRAEALSNEIAALPDLLSTLNHAEQVYNSLRQQQTAVRDKMIATQEKLARCSELKRRKQEKEQSLLNTLKKKEIYEELSEAFGKKGIQAFIIESALPEIEEEANRLLGRMTDNRMQVNIESQRETKKGGVIETLDIKISDELGTRSYEMYSGGEAFRINFALRIALSKLLARRSGAPLPTLFIDEGFGTQDSSGLGKLIEAINSIQDDFKKIIIITHLEELKDAFPVRIEVTKTDEGSTISLS